MWRADQAQQEHDETTRALVELLAWVRELEEESDVLAGSRYTAIRWSFEEGR